MQKWQGIVPEESNICIVKESREIERIPEEGGQEVTRAASEDRKKEELNDVEMEVEGEEGTVGDLD